MEHLAKYMRDRALMQFEIDYAAQSHSHRGFSPVSKVTPFLLEPFQRFWGDFEESREDKPLKRFKAREAF